MNHLHDDYCLEKSQTLYFDWVELNWIELNCVLLQYLLMNTTKELNNREWLFKCSILQFELFLLKIIFLMSLCLLTSSLNRLSTRKFRILTRGRFFPRISRFSLLNLRIISCLWWLFMIRFFRFLHCFCRHCLHFFFT